MKRLAIAALGVAAIALGGAALAGVRGIADTKNGVTVRTDAGTLQITPYTASVIRVVALPEGSSETYEPSQGIAIRPEARYRVESTPAGVELFTDSASVMVDRKTGCLTFRDQKGRILLQGADWLNNPGERRISLTAPRQGNIYGAGERGHSLRLNGDSLTFYNRQNYGYTEGDPRISQMGISVPYIVSDAGYGILFDDYARGLVVLGDTITYSSDAVRPIAAYLINTGGTLAGATDRFTALTGRQPLPPLWTLGYITSKYGYHNQKEAEGVIDTLKSRGYPVDGMILDLYWYGQETDMGRLAWDTARWPDHAAMLRNFREKGVNVVPISQPYINKKGAIDVYNELVEKGLTVRDAEGRNHDVTIWVGESGMFDVSNPATRTWLWNRLKPLTAEGLAGWWGDLGEPEVHPLSIMHANGLSAEQYHNIYGNEWSKLIFDGLRSDFPQQRPLLMMRGGTTGLQRYAVFPWTTDVSRSWGGQQPQVKLMLSSGLSGLGYMGSDVGGFAVDPKNPTDPELYVRWLQMGTFSPMLRTHAQHKPEPYNYPQYEDISKRYIKMRYQWLPYNYTLAYENVTTGAPLARPLNFRDTLSDSRLANIADEYLWGDEVLVAPVFNPGQRSRKVFFPKGSQWVDWYNPSVYHKGGSTATVKAPLDRLPLFVRAGSFIPQYMEPLENVQQYDPRFLTIKYFPSTAETSYTLFDDNHQSPTSLQDAQYRLDTFTGRRQNAETQIRVSSTGTFEGMADVRVFTFDITDTPRPPRIVTVVGSDPDDVPLRLDSFSSLKAIRQQGWHYNAATRTLSVRITYTDRPVTITAL